MTSTQPHDVFPPYEGPETYSEPFPPPYEGPQAYSEPFPPPYEGPQAYSEGHTLKEEVHTISAPSENPLRRKRNTAATVISMIYVIPYLGILIASMASTHNSFKNIFGGGKCLLYSTVDDEHVYFNTGQTCKFVIYGEAALGVVAVLLIILSVVKAVFGKW